MQFHEKIIWFIWFHEFFCLDFFKIFLPSVQYWIVYYPDYLFYPFFSYIIDTSGVGAGTLSITVDGPSKVDLSCNEVDDGYEVSYMPMAPGKYYVTVKYNGKNVRGSPFSVMVGGDNLVSSTSAATINNNRSVFMFDNIFGLYRMCDFFHNCEK